LEISGKLCLTITRIARTMPRFIIFFSFFIFLIACDHLPSVEQDPIVARVGSHYLYASELSARLLPQLTKEDSTLLAQNIINTWAKDQLLYDQALLNLDQPTQVKLNDLVERYRLDLWARSYKESVVKSMVNTEVSPEDIEAYYQQNLNSFTLKEDVIQLRYIILPADNIDLDIIQERFQRFNEEDRSFLDSLSYQFSDFELDDEVWMTKRLFERKFQNVAKSPFENYLKKSQFFLFDNAIEVYLLQVNDFKYHNDIAPLTTVKNTIEKIVFNRNKLKFIKEFDQEILQDAIQTNKFEIYP